MFDLTGFGALNLDIIYEIDEITALHRHGIYLTPGHETIGRRDELARLVSILNDEARLISKCGGGSAANTTVCLANLGFKTAFAGIAGMDADGDKILNSMHQVDLTKVVRNGKSGVCLVVIDKGLRDRAMCVFPPQTDAKTWDMLKIPDSKFLHFSSLALKNAPAIQMKLLSTTRSDFIFSFDPGEIYCSKGLDFFLELVKRADLLFLTEAELQMLYSSESSSTTTDMMIMKVFNLLRRNGNYLGLNSFPILVLKQGKNGATIFYDSNFDKNFHVPALEVKDVVDTTGAGDAFDAGFLSGIFKGKSLKDAATDGIVIATKSISAFGRSWLERSTTFDF